MDTNEGNIKQLGAVVEAAREAAGLSQRELAAIAGCRDRWIAWLECGSMDAPHAATLARVTDALRLDPVEVDWLSGGQLAGAYPGLHTWFADHQAALLEALKKQQRLIRALLAVNPVGTPPSFESSEGAS
jgi:transcriptional regulator with XRE-family HTH domain